MPWFATIEARLLGLRGLSSRRSIDPLRLRRPIILRPLNMLLLYGSDHHLCLSWLLVGQPWALWGTSRRSSCDLGFPLLDMVQSEVFFHCDGVIHQLIKILETMTQTGLKFRTHPFQKTFLLLGVGIHM